MNYLNKDNILTTNLPISGKSSNNIISNRFVSFDETDDLSLLINIFTLRGDFLHQVDDVNYKIIEGNKERIQSFKGDVIKRQGTGATATFTVRKISDGVGVERLFPVYSPNIESIVLNKAGKVSRAKLYYLRERSGKSARIKEKRMAVTK